MSYNRLLQASNKVCQVSPELIALARKFRFRKDKNVAAISSKSFEAAAVLSTLRDNQQPRHNELLLNIRKPHRKIRIICKQ